MMSLLLNRHSWVYNQVNCLNFCHYLLVHVITTLFFRDLLQQTAKLKDQSLTNHGLNIFRMHACLVGYIMIPLVQHPNLNVYEI